MQQLERDTVGEVIVSAVLRVHENGEPIEFTYQTILDYHGDPRPPASRTR